MFEYTNSDLETMQFHHVNRQYCKIHGRKLKETQDLKKYFQIQLFYILHTKEFSIYSFYWRKVSEKYNNTNVFFALLNCQLHVPSSSTGHISNFFKQTPRHIVRIHELFIGCKHVQQWSVSIRYAIYYSVSVCFSLFVLILQILKKEAIQTILSRS